MSSGIAGEIAVRGERVVDDRGRRSVAAPVAAPAAVPARHVPIRTRVARRAARDHGARRHRRQGIDPRSRPTNRGRVYAGHDLDGDAVDDGVARQLVDEVARARGCCC